MNRKCKKKQHKGDPNTKVLIAVPHLNGGAETTMTVGQVATATGLTPLRIPQIIEQGTGGAAKIRLKEQK